MNTMPSENVFYYFLLVCALPAAYSVQINVKGRMKVGEGAAGFFSLLTQYLNRNRDQSQFSSNSEPMKQDVKDWLDRNHLSNKQQSEEFPDPDFIKEAYKKWLESQKPDGNYEMGWGKKPPVRQQVPNYDQPVQVFGNGEVKNWGEPSNFNEDVLRQKNEWGHLHVYGDHGKKGNNIVDVRRYVIYKDDS